MNSTPQTLSRVKDEIRMVIDSFRDDPPDSQFQRGYLKALEWIWDVIEEEEAKT